MKLRTRICDLFGIEVPIIQTGMGWVSGPRLTAATSDAGGLGILASATMTFEQLEAAIREIKGRTTKNFGVNLRGDQEDIDQRVALLVREKVKVASFAGAPKKDVISKLKDGGVLTVPTVGARRHAEKMQAAGVDALIAQGHEGGGHTGPVPTTLLLPQVCDAVTIPVLGAGGFFDGRGLVAAMAYGASGIAMGTRFLLTKESTVPDAVKQVYLKTKVTDTVVTESIDGVPQRVIRTELIDALEKGMRPLALFRALMRAFELRSITDTSPLGFLKEGLAMKKAQGLSWTQLAMAANAPMMTKASMVDGRPEVGILPTGQVVGMIEELPTVAEVIAKITREAEETLARLAPPPAPTRSDRKRSALS